MTQRDLASSIASLVVVLESLDAHLAELVARRGASVPAPAQRAAPPCFYGEVAAFARSSIEKAAGEWIQAREAYLAYCAWADAVGSPAASERAFAMAMKRMGFEKIASATGKRERIQRYADIRLARPDAE